MSDRLKNIRVMVTRPAEQAEDLSRLIEGAGGQALGFPALVIQAAADAESSERCKFVAGYDWVIFISQNAVRHALSLLPVSNWPASTRIAAIGHSTTNALRQAGLEVDRYPEQGMNSEGLLDTFQDNSLAGQKILIIRGVGGRETLATGLRERQARVDYAEVYRRSCPELDSQRLRQILVDGIDVITIASGETLRNLAKMIEKADLDEAQTKQVYSCPLVVVSERIRILAEQLGFLDTVIVASEPGNSGIVFAIEKWLGKK